MHSTERQNEMGFISQETHPREWQYMWQRLSELTINTGLTTGADNDGEVWHYMGTVRAPDGIIWHEFRHRNHPKTGKREYERLFTTAQRVSGIEWF